MRTKIIVIFVTLFIFFTAALVAEGYYFSQKSILKRATQYTQSMVNVTAQELDRIISQINDISRAMISDDRLLQLTDAYASADASSLDYLASITQLQDALGTYALLRVEIDSLYLHTDTQRDLTFTKRLNVLQDRLLAHEAECRRLNGRPYWFLADESPGIISCMRQISGQGSREGAGFLAVNISERYLSDMYRQLTSDGGLSSDALVFLSTQEGQIVSSNDANRIGGMLDAFPQGHADDEAEIIRYNGQKSIIFTSGTLENGWRLTLILPYVHHTDGLLALRQTYIASFAIVLACGILLLTLALRRLILPLNRLDTAIARFGEGDFEARCEVTGGDEFGHLSQMFNTMANNIVQLHDTVYAQQIQLRDAELSALQMQINPHFLYNTLDTINWLAQFNGADEICDISKALASLMRYTLGGEAWVTAAQEIENVRSYIQIQTYRYDERLQIEYDLDESLLNVPIPKLILQPLVENAIVHGIENRNGVGIVRIGLHREGEFAVFTVSDNGGGMTAEQVADILERIRREEHSLNATKSIGLLNVGKRVCATCRSLEAFEISSAPSAGTVIRTKFPIPKREATQEETEKSEG